MSDRELSLQPARLATSLASAAPGQVILLGRDGQVLGGPELRRARLTWFGFQGLATGYMAGVGALAFGPFGALGLGALYLGLAARAQRRWRELRDALALTSAGDPSAAVSALDRMAARRQPGWARTAIEHGLAVSHWQAGATELAARHFDRAVGLADSRRRGRTAARLARLHRALFWSATGAVDKAERTRRDLPAEPTGDYFAVATRLLDLSIAFHRGRVSDLPDDLHDWARDFLGMSRFGVGLALLGWAFAERGEPDMAEHLVAEAPSRMGPEPLARTFPSLHAWLEARVAGQPTPAPA